MADTMDAQLEVLSQENALMKKYLALRNKCEQLQQGNEKLVNRTHHVKKLVKQYKRDRRFLQHRLDSYNDNYREAQVPVMWEEDQMYSLLKPQVPSPTTKESLPALTPEVVTTAPVKSKPCKKIKSLIKSQDQSADSGGVGTQSVERLSQLKSLYGGQSIKQEPMELLTVVKQEPVEGEIGRSATAAFMLFCEQHKQAVHTQYLKEKNEAITSHELTKRMALRWQALPNEDKKIYFAMSEFGKARMEPVVQQPEPTESDLKAMQMESDAAVSSLLNT